ncbi:exported hypothetical protein [uncultured Gammaproteobacteria bacterium]
MGGRKQITVLVAAGLVAVGLAMTAQSGWAAGQSGSSSGTRQPAPTTWSNKSTVRPSSSALWDRSTPAAPSSSSGSSGSSSSSAPAVAKPAPGGTAAAISSGGYTKPAPAPTPAPTPATPVAPATSSTTTPSPAMPMASPVIQTPAQPVGVIPSSGGYTKPALPGTSPSTAAAPAVASAAVVGTAAVAGTAVTSGQPSSGGYTKPILAATPAPAPAPAPVAGQSSGTAPQPVAAAAGATPPRSGLDRAANRQVASESMQRYRNEQERFATPAQGTFTGTSDYTKSSLYRNQAGRYQSYDAVYNERDTWRTSHPWQPPAYTYRSAPSFGMWDAMFWWMVLDKLSQPGYASAAYHNAGDPGYQAWRREADRMGQDNIELRAKLASLDAKVGELKGQPVKPGTLPEGIPAGVALAPAVTVAPREKGLLVMGTGNASGNYYPFCHGGTGMRGLRGYIEDTKVECRETNGSVENLEGLVRGDFDAIMIQADVFHEWTEQHPGVRVDALKATIYQEYVQMLANKVAKVEQITDLDPAKHTIYLVGSGASKTWDNFATLDKRYAAFDAAEKVRRVSSDPQILEVVVANPNAVMMFVSGLNSDLLRKANDRYGDKLQMVLVNDGRLEAAKDRTGHSLYAFAKIRSGIYPKLQQSRWFGLTSAVPSLSVGAVFVLSEQWVLANGVKALSRVEEALWKSMPEIEKKVGTGG